MINYVNITRPRQPLGIGLSLLAVVLALIAVVALIVVGPGRLRRNLHHAVPTPTFSLPSAVAPVVPDPQLINIDHRAQQIEQIIARHWTDSLLAIEQSSGKDVTLLELHPDLTGGNFTLHGEARTFPALLSYVQRLNETGLVRNVALTHEQAISRDNVETIEFQMQGNLGGARG